MASFPQKAATTIRLHRAAFRGTSTALTLLSASAPALAGAREGTQRHILERSLRHHDVDTGDPIPSLPLGRSQRSRAWPSRRKVGRAVQSEGWPGNRYAAPERPQVNPIGMFDLAGLFRFFSIWLDLEAYGSCYVFFFGISLWQPRTLSSKSISLIT